MLRRILALVAVAGLAALPARAQEETPLTEAEGWRTSLKTSLQFTQAAYRNWQEGGINALSLTTTTNGKFERRFADFKQTHDVRLAFGLLKQDTLDVRKADDQIRYAFALQYAGIGRFQPTFGTEIRTQFAAGFDYKPTAEKYPDLADLIVPGERLKVSAFFAPAVWTQALGLTYEPGDWYKVRLGFGAKETIVLIERLRPVYGNRLDQPVRVQAGFEALAEVRRDLFENVSLVSRLGLFHSFETLDQPPDGYWENTITMKVNSFINVTLAAEALLDQDVSDEIQLREVLAVGVSVALL